MALPKIDTPIYEMTLPVSKKKIKYRPFLVKEQKNLLMAMEANDGESIQTNIKQVLHNCTLTENVNIDSLPIVDIEYFFLQLRARSVGEVVTNKYRCNNKTEEKECNNVMEVEINLLDIKVENLNDNDEVVQVTDKISVKLNYPEFSVIKEISKVNSLADAAFEMIARSIDYVYDGEQFHYAKESTTQELVEFLESLNQQQFSKIEEFFSNLPKIEKKIEMKCSRCGFTHIIEAEGLESFFG
jgi:hypothetical protein